MCTCMSNWVTVLYSIKNCVWEITIKNNNNNKKRLKEEEEKKKEMLIASESGMAKEKHAIAR